MPHKLTVNSVDTYTHEIAFNGRTFNLIIRSHDHYLYDSNNSMVKFIGRRQNWVSALSEALQWIKDNP